MKLWKTLVALALGIGAAGIGIWFVSRARPPRLMDLSTNQTRFPEGAYHAVNWITEDTMVFIYASTSGQPLREYDLVRGSLDTGQLATIEVPTDSDCINYEFLSLPTLDHDSITFLGQCNTYLDGVTGIRRQLVDYKPSTQSISLLYQYPPQFHATGVTVSSDRRTWIHAEWQTHIADRLYEAPAGGPLRPLLTQFSRAGEPALTPDGRYLAFAANETLPTLSVSPLGMRRGVQQTIAYPWDLYLLDRESGTLVKAVEGIRHVAAIRWSPSGTNLTFLGDYRGRRGLWLLPRPHDVGSSPVLVWDAIAAYAWSPDGTRLVVVAPVASGSNEGQRPLLVDLSRSGINTESP